MPELRNYSCISGISETSDNINYRKYSSAVTATFIATTKNIFTPARFIFACRFQLHIYESMRCRSFIRQRMLMAFRSVDLLQTVMSVQPLVQHRQYDERQ